MLFTETEICTNRLNCWHCRNDKGFRDAHELTLGKWECPLGLSLDCGFEPIPQTAKDNYTLIKQRDARNEKLKANAIVAFNELKLLGGEMVLQQLNEIAIYAFPEVKKHSACFHCSKTVTGKTEEVCCGGKIETVDQYGCSIRGATTDRICQACTEFKLC